jgi:transcriptional regulator with XRE-family HTH domain
MTQAVNHIDKTLGARLRQKRTASGLSEAELARKLQIDPKQIVEYEEGLKRISADHLLHLGRVLGVRPVYFFGFPEQDHSAASEVRRKAARPHGVYLTLPEQGARLHRAFFKIQDPKLREELVTLVTEMAGRDRVREFELDLQSSH